MWGGGSGFGGFERGFGSVGIGKEAFPWLIACMNWILRTLKIVAVMV